MSINYYQQTYIKAMSTTNGSNQIKIGEINPTFKYLQALNLLPYFKYDLIIGVSESSQVTLQYSFKPFHTKQNQGQQQACQIVKITYAKPQQNLHLRHQTRSKSNFLQDKLMLNCTHQLYFLQDRPIKKHSSSQFQSAKEAKTNEQQNFANFIRSPTAIFFIFFAHSITFSLNKEQKKCLKQLLNQMGIRSSWKKGINYYKAILQTSSTNFQQSSRPQDTPMISSNDLADLQRLQTQLYHEQSRPTVININYFLARVKQFKMKNAFIFCQDYFNTKLFKNLLEIQDEEVVQEYQRIQDNIQFMHSCLSCSNRYCNITEINAQSLFSTTLKSRNQSNSKKVRRSCSIIQIQNLVDRRTDYSAKALKLYIRNKLVQNSNDKKTQNSAISQFDNSISRQMHIASDIVRQIFENQLKITKNLHQQQTKQTETKNKRNCDQKQIIKNGKALTVQQKKQKIIQIYTTVVDKIKDQIKLDYKSECLIQTIINKVTEDAATHQQNAQNNNKMEDSKQLSSKIDQLKISQIDKGTINLSISEQLLISESTSRQIQMQMQIQSSFLSQLKSPIFKKDADELNRYIQYLQYQLKRCQINYASISQFKQNKEKLMKQVQEDLKKQISPIYYKDRLKGQKQKQKSPIMDIDNTKQASYDNYINNKIKQIKKQSLILKNKQKENGINDIKQNKNESATKQNIVSPKSIPIGNSSGTAKKLILSNNNQNNLSAQFKNGAKEKKVNSLIKRTNLLKTQTNSRKNLWQF